MARIKKASAPIFEVLESSQVSDEAMKHWIALQDGMKETITPCANQPEFYADRSIEVSVDKAEEMCYGCPLIKVCYDYAVADKITAGIWGGVHFDEDEGVLFE